MECAIIAPSANFKFVAPLIISPFIKQTHEIDIYLYYWNYIQCGFLNEYKKRTLKPTIYKEDECIC